MSTEFIAHEMKPQRIEANPMPCFAEVSAMFYLSWATGISGNDCMLFLPRFLREDEIERKETRATTVIQVITEHSPYVRYCAKSFIYICSLNPHHNLIR